MARNIREYYSRFIHAILYCTVMSRVQFLDIPDVRRPSSESWQDQRKDLSFLTFFLFFRPFVDTSRFIAMVVACFPYLLLLLLVPSIETLSPVTSTMSAKKAFIPAVYDGFVDAIGNTPMIFLRGPSERTGCKIYGKAEFLNPGGSVKVR